MRLEVSASGQLETFLEPNDNQYPNVWFVHEKQGWQRYIKCFGCHNKEQVGERKKPLNLEASK